MSRKYNDIYEFIKKENEKQNLLENNYSIFKITIVPMLVMIALFIITVLHFETIGGQYFCIITACYCIFSYFIISVVCKTLLQLQHMRNKKIYRLLNELNVLYRNKIKLKLNGDIEVK